MILFYIHLEKNNFWHTINLRYNSGSHKLIRTFSQSIKSSYKSMPYQIPLQCMESKKPHNRQQLSLSRRKEGPKSILKLLILPGNQCWVH
jgi:hypothetical protein